MPKMEAAGRVRQISLAQIVENGNVRNDYTEIEELAESIKINGLIEPIAVKALGKDENDIEKYELVAGFRRHRAFRYLCDKGENFSMIDVVIVTGDKLTIQLVENLQRSDLTHTEQEAGIYKLAESLGSNKETAARLGKSDFFVARNVTAHRIRCALYNFGINTNSLSTKALCAIQSLSGERLKGIGQKLVAGGGSASLAQRLMREHNAGTAKAETLIQPEEPEPETLDDTSEPHDNVDDGIEHDENLDTTDVNEPTLPTAEPRNSPAKKTGKKTSARVLEEPPHKQVDLNSVQVVIQGYIDKIGSSEAGYEYEYKTNAAYEIWSLLLAELAES